MLFIIPSSLDNVIIVNSMFNHKTILWPISNSSLLCLWVCACACSQFCTTDKLDFLCSLKSRTFEQRMRHLSFLIPSTHISQKILLYRERRWKIIFSRKKRGDFYSLSLFCSIPEGWWGILSIERACKSFAASRDSDIMIIQFFFAESVHISEL